MPQRIAFLTSAKERLHDVFSEERRQGLKFTLRVLSLAPPLAGAMILFLFAAVPQMREVYLGLIEERDVWRAGLGLVLMMQMCGMIYVWHFWVGSAAIDRCYPEHANLDLDTRLLGLRNTKAVFCAALPFIGLMFGLWALQWEVSNGGQALDQIAHHFRPEAGTTLAAEFRSTKSTLTLAQLAMFPVLIAMLVALMAMQKMFPKSGVGDRFRFWWAAVSVALGIATVALPFVAPNAVVPVARLLGPPAMIMLALSAFVTTAAMISLGIKKIDSSIVKGGLAASGVLFILYAMFANIGADVLGRKQAQASAPPQRATDVEAKRAFREWLKARADRGQYAGRPYPVFIFAAQGGGIYATAAATAFLSAMQDACSNFAQHVFAVSGVSGGAVGTAVFSGLMQDVPQSSAKCGAKALGPLKPEDQVVSRRADAIVLDDHLAPLIGVVAADTLRILTFNRDGDIDRAKALERSFACSYDQYRDLRPDAGSTHLRGTLPGLCGPTGSGQGLRVGYDGYWTPRSTIPAPILNAVWAEVGYRVVFSPFKLRAVGDGTLYSFTDLPLLASGGQRSLIEAAMVSARFPIFAPPQRLLADVGATAGERTAVWSFVDGGYVDNSGASTGLDLYKLVESAAKDAEREDGIKVDLRMVLLTNSEAKLDYGAINSDGWDDVWAPIEAMLNVRRQLSQRAVTQAVDYVARQQPSLGSARARKRSEDSAILVVDVEQQTFRLPLGWKISNVTNDIVRLMMGRPDLCPVEPRPAETPTIESFVRTIEQNSCVKRQIARLLGAEG